MTFRRLEVVSFLHSGVYLCLLVCAFILSNPEPATFILGLAHGLLWIGMSIVCIVAARIGVIPFWLAVTVAILGGLGPLQAPGDELVAAGGAGLGGAGSSAAQ